MAKSNPMNLYAGPWRIVSMSAWDLEFVDEEEKGYFEFDQNYCGQFHFGYVHGQMSCFVTTRNGKPVVKWTWEGNDEMDPAHGRGWAVVNGDKLQGMIFFHGGDESEFVAKNEIQNRTKDKP